jgi:hypothetical protein
MAGRDGHSEGNAGARPSTYTAGSTGLLLFNWGFYVSFHRWALIPSLEFDYIGKGSWAVRLQFLCASLQCGLYWTFFSTQQPKNAVRGADRPHSLSGGGS